MLICGVYNSPKTKYQEMDLLNHLTEKMDDFLDTKPDGVVLCGGDFNNLKIENLITNVGLDVMMDFPTRNNAILDINCLTNRADLFTKPYQLQMQIKTDHLGIIVPPPGTKLKPIRVKCTIRDRRTHRIHTTINSLLDSCLPTRTVKMSTRDPIWLTPLVKSLLQRKYKLVARGKNDQAEEVSKRIAEIIAQNRRNMDAGTFGSGSWWNKIDKLSLRKDTPRVLLERN
jgi:hypothetical protein